MTATQELTEAPPIKIEGRCNARKPTGLLCNNAAGKGTDHLGYGRCYLHGGASPNGRKAAITQRALGEAGQLLAAATEIVQGRTTLHALQDLRNHSAGMVLALRTIIDGLPLKARWELDTITDAKGAAQRFVNLLEDGLIGVDDKANQRANVLLTLYGEWVDRSLRVEKVVAELGLEERRVQVDEAIGVAVAAEVLASLAAVGIDPAPVMAELGPRLQALDAVNTTGTET